MELLKQILEPLRDRCESYLSDDLGIASSASQMSDKAFDDVEIKSTSIIALTGSFDIFVAIGYSQSLFDAIVDIFLDGDEVVDEEIDEIKESISSEIINIVVGNAIKNPIDNSVINITPPLFVDDMGMLFRDKHSKIATISIDSNVGSMYVAIVKPSRENSFFKESRC